MSTRTKPGDVKQTYDNLDMEESASNTKGQRPGRSTLQVLPVNTQPDVCSFALVAHPSRNSCSHSKS